MGTPPRGPLNGCHDIPRGRDLHAVRLVRLVSGAKEICPVIFGHNYGEKHYWTNFCLILININNFSRRIFVQ